MALYIGLISGTSVDAIDAVLCDISSSSRRSINLLNTLSLPYPQSLQDELLKFGKLQYQGDSIDQLGRLDHQVGQYFAEAVKLLLENSPCEARDIVGIGSHGQTVRHRPKADHPFTLQIGDANIIAAQTGITTVADFRRKDMAFGGQGAPFAPAFHQAFFADESELRAVVNLGGIANVTVLRQGKDTIGFDTGPANTLMDQWINKHQGLAYDKQGQWALTGSIIQPLLDDLLSEAYFDTLAPKSTGCEYFNLDWLEPYIKASYAPEDVQRTLLELTALTVYKDITRYISLGTVYICGGGAHNKALLGRLQELLLPIKVETTDVLGINPDWVEAMAFAWFARQTLNRETVDLKSITGARENTIIGGIYHP
ncbi:anhydro-N-acetylmuramic acid kinase [Kangiella sediminilitoris]|uniref:Anhydro-N-acetylmuramic acid kinase n=1 Tax=Kangiella sediminilitoris TaxID=1144748 RepID=A0A1B3BD19_9GAMM|nr:anhydro-N-acetylmuramic acid kinase [Kangiella sediminilitoris]AOE50719.1 Anhydro-N-acetylmuramic acid kinase [Kangiella sediminilitoris]